MLCDRAPCFRPLRRAVVGSPVQANRSGNGILGERKPTSSSLQRKPGIRVGHPAWLLTLLLVPSVASASERFILEVPGQPSADSTVVTDAGGLTVDDAAGNVFRYRRREDLDSSDGRYLGYYCSEARRYLRWPRTGRGQMFIGREQRGVLAWKESLMQVRPAAQPFSRPSEGLDRDAPVDRMHFTVLKQNNGSTALAQIDGDGQLAMYTTAGDRWQRAETDLAMALPPGAPLVLFDDPVERLPSVYTANGDGELTEIVSGRVARELNRGGVLRLAPRSYLARSTNPREVRVYVTDTRGRLWDVGLRGDDHRRVESKSGAFLAGQPLVALSADTEQVFAVDTDGGLLHYQESATGAWAPPDRVGRGFVPGGYIAATYRKRGGVIHLASVDADGRLRVLRSGSGGWTAETVNGVALTPGAPLGIAASNDGVTLSAVRADGRWHAWQRRGGDWMATEIAQGFPVGAPVSLCGPGPFGFAVDRRGYVVVGTPVAGRWRCSVCCPAFAFAPQLASRAIVPNPQLAPVNVDFVNTHDEELVLRIFDHRLPGEPTELRIKPQETWKYRIDRDTGGTLEEVYLVPGPFGQLVEQVHQYPVPACSLYDIVVYTNRVTSVYFDRTKNRSSVPDSIQRSLVSLGVFPLPPGRLLNEGSRVDVHAEAKRQGNPGAAALFGRP